MQIKQILLIGCFLILTSCATAPSKSPIKKTSSGEEIILDSPAPAPVSQDESYKASLTASKIISPITD